MSIDIPSSVDAEYAATEEAKFRDYLVGSEGATELLRSLVALDEFKAKPADATQWMRAKTGSQDLSCLVHGVEAPDVRGMLKENAKLKQKLEVFTEQLQKLTQELGPRLALGAFRTPIATEPPLESWMPEYVVRKANIGKQTFSLCALSLHPNWRLCCANEEPHATMVHARWYSCADVVCVCVCVRVRAQPMDGSSPTSSRARPTRRRPCSPSTAGTAARRSGCGRSRSTACGSSAWIGRAMATRTSRPGSTGTPSRRLTCSSWLCVRRYSDLCASRWLIAAERARARRLSRATRATHRTGWAWQTLCSWDTRLAAATHSTWQRGTSGRIRTCTAAALTKCVADSPTLGTS